MKEAAMRGQDQRFAVQQPGQCQIVGEEIDSVDMDDVAIVQMVSSIKNSLHYVFITRKMGG